jgi:hypothetical protein
MIVVSFLIAIMITCSTAVVIQSEGNRVNSDMSNTILDNKILVESLKKSQSEGVELAIHGLEHENYTVLSSTQIANNIDKSKLIFDAAGFKSNLFVSPYEISGVPEITRTNTSITNMGLSIPFNGATVFEYTWAWNNMTSFSDPRYGEAVSQIYTDKPETIVFHAQDWNIYTKKFINDYLSNTSDSSTIIRMDDIDANTPINVIEEASVLHEYKSVKREIFAVIPSGFWQGNNPSILGIEVNNIMQVYFIFFLIKITIFISHFYHANCMLFPHINSFIRCLTR